MSDQHVIPSLGRTGNTQTCDTCRHFSPSAVAPGMPERPGGCNKLGKPVDLTIMTREQVEAAHSMIGSSCPEYNSPGTANPEMAQIKVAFPMVFVDPEEDDDWSTVSSGRVSSCLDCKFFVEYRRIQDKGLFPGWGMCGAKGNLVNPNSHREVAGACDKRQAKNELTSVGHFSPRVIQPDAISDSDIRSLQMVPSLDLATVNEYAARADQTVTILPPDFDPMTYTSKVPARYVAMGVKGLVKLNDPSGTGNTVTVPIFDRNHWGPETESLIPKTGDDEHPEDYVDYMENLWRVGVLWFELDQSPTFWGQPGIGKTEFARYLAWLMQLPLIRIPITGSTELDDIEGYTVFENGETRFKYGRVATWWQRPCVLYIDEPNVGPREVWQFLRPVMDDSKSLHIDAADGEELPKDDFCMLVLAANPAWDMRNEGTHDIADADVRRMSHIDFDYPDKETEAKIIKIRLKSGDDFDIPDQLLTKVQTIGEGLRRMSNELPITWGVGQQIKVSRFLRWFPAVDAYKLAAASYLDPEQRERMLTEVRTTFEVV